MNFNTVYVSSNCNQTPTAADCSENDLIAYASCNAVLIYNPTLDRVTNTLVAHKKRVNSVRWIKHGPKPCFELVSGSTDGSVLIWRLKDREYVATPLLSEDSSVGVNIVDACYADNTYVCSAGIDTCSLRIWCRNKDTTEFVQQQSFQFGSKSNPSFCVGVRFGLAPKQGKPILACALDNSKIHVLTCNGIEWVTSQVLTGHEDWVRGLDFAPDCQGNLLLASCSQDCFIRIWKLSNLDKDGIDVSLESVIAGHEGWVYSVNWSPVGLQLLSASIDKSLIIWEFDSASGLWLEKVRLGEVGGNTLGFYGGFFNATGNQVIAHSYHGAFHIWRENDNDLWVPVVTPGGHFGEVVDLAWEPQGEFLYSVSTDQTTRIHAPWQRDENVNWHEIARPQVHGYDLSSIAVISRYRYASGAEEKVIRTFQAPETFIQNFKRICRDTNDWNDNESSGTVIPKGAAVPSLGLSNKAVYTEDNINETLPLDSKIPYPEESHFKAQILTEPPTEETLLQNTLWPESQKLYGHGYEIFSLAASNDGKYLASACKSTKPQHSVILLWDTSNWQQIQQLASHTLTVVQMQFSPDSRRLLSVSRDRRWSLFSLNSEGKFDLVATTDKQTSVHTRIIWTCAWTHDSQYFATGSREGRVVVWTENPKKTPIKPLGQYEQFGDCLDFPNQSVTALAFAPDCIKQGYLCAIGFDSGGIELFLIRNETFEKVLYLPNSIAHHLTVRKLSFRPKFGRAGHKNVDRNVIQLSSASSDTTVRIFDLLLCNL